MFGHKNDSKTVVGDATIQNPSMLDNISPQDLVGDDGSSSMDAKNPMSPSQVVGTSASGSSTISADNTFMASSSLVTPASGDQTLVSPVSDNSMVNSQNSFTTTDVGSSSDGPNPIPGDLHSNGTSINETAFADAPTSLSAAPKRDDVRPIDTPVVSASGPIDPPPMPDEFVSLSAEPSAPFASAEAPVVESVPMVTETPSSPPPAIAVPSVPTEAITPTSDIDSDMISDEISNDIQSDLQNIAKSQLPDGKDDTLADSDTSTKTAPPVDLQKLAQMKQHVLDHLEPLVEKLEQGPEDEFKTTMMMIQANDNHALLEKALNAAKRIGDDSERAKALLDIINEINYFSQSSSTPSR